MVLWISLSVVLTLLLAATALAVAMVKAERRARRRLYRALGLGDDAVDLLMARSGDVLTELSLLRMSPAGRDPAPAPGPPVPEDLHPILVSEAATPRAAPQARPGRAASGREALRRRPHPGRRRL